MQGAARMVLDGQHPAIIRNAVATPGGCTIGGLLTMEDGKIRSTMVSMTHISFELGISFLGADNPRGDQCCWRFGEKSTIVRIL